MTQIFNNEKEYYEAKVEGTKILDIFFLFNNIGGILCWKSMQYVNEKMNKIRQKKGLSHSCHIVLNPLKIKAFRRSFWFESTSIEIDKISVKNFGATMGQNTLKAFKIKAFSASSIGFESRTGHQKTAFMQKIIA